MKKDFVISYSFLFSVRDDIISTSRSGSSSCADMGLVSGSVDVTYSSLLDKSTFSSPNIIVSIMHEDN